MKLLILGDSVRATTGFSTVIRALLQYSGDALNGWEVWQIGSQDADCSITRTNGMALPAPLRALVHGNWADPMAFGEVAPTLRRFRPDVVLIVADCVTVMAWMDQLQAAGSTAPVVAYVPVEGGPVSRHLLPGYKRPARTFTMTEWSSNELKLTYDLDVPYAYHGVDPAFFVEDPYQREQVRRAIGWQNDHVIVYVARNGARKAHDALLLGFAMAHKQRPDLSLRLYLHCTPFARHELLGWDLREIAEDLHVDKWVQFSEQVTATEGLEIRTLVDLLRAADQYVHPAMCEGFGLPILEAMAAGLPVALTQDRANMSEVGGRGVNYWMPPCNSRFWHTGAIIQDVSPATIAQAIIAQATMDPAVRADVVQRGRVWASGFRWDPAAEMILGACREEALSHCQARAIAKLGEAGKQ